MHRNALVLAVVAVLAALTVGSAVALAGGGNNAANAKKCQKGGWQSLYTRTGQPFASQAACAAYGAKGDQLIPASALACLNGGWEALGTAEEDAFNDEQECVDYAVGGHTPVTLPSNTPPTLNLPSNITVEAEGPTGATVTYAATANDDEDGALPPTCLPASSSTFALGTTTVNCSATDSGSLTATGSFTVTVEDTTSPILNLPGGLTVAATGPTGAYVNFVVAANDDVDGIVAVYCLPASGNFFLVGQTQVFCSATDNAGNNATGSFNVTVQ